MKPEVGAIRQPSSKKTERQIIKNSQHQADQQTPIYDEAAVRPNVNYASLDE